MDVKNILINTVMLVLTISPSLVRLYTVCVVLIKPCVHVYSTWNRRRVAFLPVCKVRWNSGFDFLPE